MRVVKAFAREPYESEQFEMDNRKLLSCHLNATWIWSNFVPVMELLSSLCTPVMLMVGAADGAFWRNGSGYADRHQRLRLADREPDAQPCQHREHADAGRHQRREAVLLHRLRLLHTREGRREGAREARGARGIRPRGLLLWRRGRAEEHHVLRGTRSDRRRHGRDRRGQELADSAARPLLRRAQGQREGGRNRCARPEAEASAPQHRLCAAGNLPVL